MTHLFLYFSKLIKQTKISQFGLCFSICPDLSMFKRDLKQQYSALVLMSYSLQCFISSRRSCALLLLLHGSHWVNCDLFSCCVKYTNQEKKKQK